MLQKSQKLSKEEYRILLVESENLDTDEVEELVAFYQIEPVSIASQVRHQYLLFKLGNPDLVKGLWKEAKELLDRVNDSCSQVVEQLCWLFYRYKAKVVLCFKGKSYQATNKRIVCRPYAR